jgi:hypothetical protein
MSAHARASVRVVEVGAGYAGLRRNDDAHLFAMAMLFTTTRGRFDVIDSGGCSDHRVR